jgi:GT2 family glycosyltransferase
MSNKQRSSTPKVESDNLRVTIVVSPRERFEQAEMSLQAIFAKTEIPFRLIYVDGGSPKAIGRALEAAVTAAGHTYIRRDVYLSPNQARNIAMPLVETEFVAFLDNDVIFEPGWLPALIACADETGAGLVTPTILVGPESRFPDLVIHHAGGVLDLTPTPNGWDVHRRHGHEFERYLEVRDTLVRGETGCTEFHVVLARKAMLDQIGPFDDQLIGFTDEIDMALSARKHGWKIVYEPTSVVAYAVGKPLTWRERPYFCLRWSTHLCLRAERYFYAKWDLIPDFERQYSFLRQHRRHAFPFKTVQKIIGWRLTVALRSFVCDLIGFVAAFNIRLPKPAKIETVRARPLTASVAPTPVTP